MSTSAPWTVLATVEFLPSSVATPPSACAAPPAAPTMTIAATDAITGRRSHPRAPPLGRTNEAPAPPAPTVPPPGRPPPAAPCHAPCPEPTGTPYGAPPAYCAP